MYNIYMTIKMAPFLNVCFILCYIISFFTNIVGCSLTLPTVYKSWAATKETAVPQLPRRGSFLI